MTLTVVRDGSREMSSLKRYGASTATKPSLRAVSRLIPLLLPQLWVAASPPCVKAWPELKK